MTAGSPSSDEDRPLCKRQMAAGSPSSDEDRSLGAAGFSLDEDQPLCKPNMSQMAAAAASVAEPT
eukprot:CAMPEP_0119066246 /NCGR_PEP_ID=MMETSP1178-20130426/8859_1 /TAXON_ID=33656 /ORGANISM="unid sp, Strain CCMP2000" /LENGTH=64 /DNA_ID=CAMNT_0007047829 /DNA_START=6 /DNA_END=196 /DNA_ORIENTATION=-